MLPFISNSTPTGKQDVLFQICVVNDLHKRAKSSQADRGISVYDQFQLRIKFFFGYFLKFLADTCPFMGATGTPVLDFW